MKVTYNGPCDAIELADTGQIIERGQSVEVDDELGFRLVEQSSFDTDPKTVLAFAGEDPDSAARMLRAELDGARRLKVVRPLEKLLKVDEPASLDDNPPPADPPADPDSAKTEG